MEDRANWLDLETYLIGLHCKNDERMGDSILVRTPDGEIFHAEFIEVEDDPILGENRIILECQEWA